MGGWKEGGVGRKEDWLGQQTSIFASCRGQGRGRPGSFTKGPESLSCLWLLSALGGTH